MPTKAIVVDDDAGVAALIVAILAGAGMAAEAETSSARAAERLAREKFDAIFLDVSMPAPDGIELARRARAGGYNQKTPIVMITGLEEPGVMRRGFDAGVNFFLCKPVDRKTLLRVVRASQDFVTREKRRFQRIAVSLPVTLETKGKKLQGKTVDLSLNGMLVKAAEMLEKGTQVEITLQVNDGPQTVKAKGSVVRTAGANRMGIEFQLAIEEDGERLQEFMLPRILSQMGGEPEEKRERK